MEISQLTRIPTTDKHTVCNVTALSMNSVSDYITETQDGDDPIADIGTYLKKIRTQSNFSVEKLAEHTKIRKENILAIENNEELSHIPNAYHRGYVKCYCLFFGLDANKILEQLPAEKYEIPVSSYSPVNTFQVRRSGEPKEDKVSSPRSGRNKLLSLVALCAIFGYSGYQQYQRAQSAQEPAQSQITEEQGQVGSIINIS